LYKLNAQILVTVINKVGCTKLKNYQPKALNIVQMCCQVILKKNLTISNAFAEKTGINSCMLLVKKH